MVWRVVNFTYIHPYNTWSTFKGLHQWYPRHSHVFDTGKQKFSRNRENPESRLFSKAYGITAPLCRIVFCFAAIHLTLLIEASTTRNGPDHRSAKIRVNTSIYCLPEAPAPSTNWTQKWHRELVSPVIRCRVKQWQCEPVSVKSPATDNEQVTMNPWQCEPVDQITSDSVNQWVK